MTGEPRVELRGVSKRFGDFTALAPLDLSVAAGELLALLGPAGAGKSTVLRLVAGLDRPTAGTVAIDGLDVTPLPPQRRDVAMVFQSPALYPHLSVAQNLAFPMRAARIGRNVIERRVGEVLDRLRLAHVRHHKPRRLTSDERQLASLGRAIVRDAKAQLHDEPLAPFTGDHRENMRRELRAIHEELRATTILATRDPLDAITTADRICVINEGRLLQCDTPQVVYDRPADLFVAHYLGSRAMNFLDAAIDDDATARLACCAIAFRINDGGARPVDPSKLTLGIRPEHVRIDPRGAAAVVTAAADDAIELRLGEVVIRSHARAREGEQVRVRLNPAGCRWFDATSGKALPWSTEES